MRLLFVTAIAAILTACGGDSGQKKLTGTALGFEEGTKLYWQSIDENNQPVILDTLIVQGGKVSIDLESVEGAELRLITEPVGRKNMIVFNENQDIKIAMYKDSMQASRATGGRSNDLYGEYNQTLRQYAVLKKEKAAAYKQARQEQDGILINILQEENKELMSAERAFKKQFVQQNPNSLFTMIILSELINKKDITADEAREIVENTSPEVLNTLVGKTVKESLEAMKNVEIGGIAPKFEAPNPAGEIVSLKEVKGKVTLIDFWASWCKPCRVENPNLVKAYEAYHDKGFNIIGVSLDQPNGKARWIKAIADDGLPWPQISNLQFWQDPIARMYNVHAIPASFLLDENGVIIAKNLRGPQLEAKLAQLFDN
ncbi:redoxin domain-containing protein [Gilvibacter sp.]|uniref:redoxin domain-containing protein n=1 Tax=Gilvibacter sp. TaxID=2729997 RepID=UPI003F4A6DFC